MNEPNEGAQAPDNAAGEPEAAGIRAGDLFAEARVVDHEGDRVRVELDAGHVGWLAAEDAGEVAPGDLLPVLIETIDGDEVQLSRHKGERLALWQRLEVARRGGDPLEATILARVRGGFSVDLGLKAFLPGRDAALEPSDSPAWPIGEKVQVRVARLDARKGQITVSQRERVARAERAPAPDAVKLDEFEVGQVVDGVVARLADFGAFVDLGGVDGLLHISDLAWRRVKRPSEVVAVGDAVRVKVLDIDLETRKIALGLKQLQGDPWADIGEKYAVGAEVEGPVRSLAPYGAFVELEEGVDGLIHVSELSRARIGHPKEAVRVGETVRAVVKGIDAERQRISLTRKPLLPNPWATLRESYPVGTRVEGRVRSITDYGVFVELEPGMDGLIHQSDLSWIPLQGKVGDHYRKGQLVEAMVLGVDVERERCNLGIKQFFPNDAGTALAALSVGDVVEGTVVRVVEFGAFVALESGIEGLIHASELGEAAEGAPTVEVGQGVRPVILSVDVVEGRVALSIRATRAGSVAAEPEPEAAVAAEPEPEPAAEPEPATEPEPAAEPEPPTEG